ncbi:hypothetical protein D9758_007905 [Tetrapyrgos nigripes]|uniref:FAD-binding PCMH-type domain-containing protein n=1 Tax=Tetrapyrgos nigripes TaxID=182062 RepID=A0A8H5D5B1_9AGAR|nr:hypothetical protein D9758_007905 [Tetrapyrgos nigripes]
MNLNSEGYVPIQRANTATHLYKASSHPYSLQVTMIPDTPRFILKFLALLLSSRLAFADDGISTRLPVCRALPEDKDWPSLATWDAFNASVDGRLIRTVPIGSPCHNPTFDAEQCQFVRDHWHEVSLHLPSSSSVMTPFFANGSCDPFTPPDAQCIIGSYVQYAVNVSTKAHVVKTLGFAREHNLRFVVRNTGHDYMGKSTGKGGLAIWTHYLQDMEWIAEYDSEDGAYRGPAIKASAGASVEQLYDFAAEKGSVVVGGDCPTVGFAGGYIQGAGHSVLSSLYGLAADSALEYGVITTDGRFLTASPAENLDLYWALSGGGGGTYGIVWTVTVKAHPDTPVTIANLSFTDAGISQDVYWEAITAYSKFTPAFADAGGYLVAVYSQSSFQGEPFFMPNKTIDEVNALTSGLRARLDELGVTYTYATNSFIGFRAAYATIPFFLELPVGTDTYGGRLLPRDLLTESSLPRTVQVLRDVTSTGASVSDVSLKATIKNENAPPNAVLPAWREAGKFLITLLPWNDTATPEEMLATRNRITNVVDPPLRQLAPNSGTYLNEVRILGSPLLSVAMWVINALTTLQADSDEPNWQHAFYGENYDQLLEIKDKYDPDQMLYGSTAVGGDRWAEDEDGRLCRVGAHQKVRKSTHDS